MVKDEANLIQQALEGDLDAFNHLIITYQDAVYGVAYRIMGDGDSAADATQETFISTFRRLETYRGGSFKAWLLRIATNTCYDELRRRQRRPTTGIDDLPGADSDDGAPLAADSVTPEEAIQQSELQWAIQDCINSLQDDQRLVLILSDIEGYSYQEIADHTDAQLGTVKSRLSRARLGMRRCLDAVRELLPAEFRLISDD